MDEYGSGARGRRSGDEPEDDGRKAASDREYSWGGSPGEDFGPITPLPPSRSAPGRSPDEPLLADTVRTQATPSRVPPAPGAVTPTAAIPVRARRRVWQPMVTMLAVLLVLVGLVGGVLLVLSRQAITGERDLSEADSPPALAVASPAASPVAVSTPVVAESPATSGSPVAQVPASPAPAATPAATATTAAVLGLGTVVPGVAGASPAAAGSPGATNPPATRATPTTIALTATPRAASSQMATPTPPNLFPPGLRFPTNTPARIVATRTPPPVPTLRPPTDSSPLRVDRPSYKVGEDASVCAQATHGSSAVIEVLGPDGTQRRLVEFQPPADRVCQILKLENPGIYVLTLVVKDGGGRELERHATVISAAR